MLDIPLIDLSRWASSDVAGRQALCREVDQAGCGVGFMEIVGHGVSEAQIGDLRAAMDGFFGLPAETKQRHVPQSAETNRGYSPPRSERLSYSLGLTSPADLFEAFNVGRPASAYPALDLPAGIYADNIWPPEAPGFRSSVETWFLSMSRLADRVLSVFAESLGQSADFFRTFTDHSVDVLRMNHYRVPGEDVTLTPDELGMGPHTDFGIVTMLWAEAGPGLQILGLDDRWHDVLPREGALLVNLGDLLARWTNDHWRSTLHRVLPPVDATGRPYQRRSAAFFRDGNPEAVVTPVAGRADGAEGYGPITVAEHLASKLAGSRMLQVNEHASEDAERVRAARRPT